MKEFEVSISQPDLPLPITQEICNRVSSGLKEKFGEYYIYTLPKVKAISDIELFRLDYFNSALELIKHYPGFDEHIKEFKNNFNSTFFVTVLADLLVSHGLKIILEPTSIGTLKKADILAFQSEELLRIHFECKQPDENSKRYLNEQKQIFNDIKSIISKEYSLALFYRNKLSSDHTNILKTQIIESLANNEIYENKVLANIEEIGLKLIISGISDNFISNSKFEISGIPNFSNERKYSNANVINHYGKNIVFYKESNMNSIDTLLKNSKKKVINNEPYVVCLDLSGPRFDWSKSEKHILNHFSKSDYTHIS